MRLVRRLEGRFRVGLFALFVAVVVSSEVYSQSNCDCGRNQTYGQCIARILNEEESATPGLATNDFYPDSFPGPGAVVPAEFFASEPENPDRARVYVADLFSGRTYRFRYNSQQILPAPVPPTEQINIDPGFIASPGAGVVTGLTFAQGMLYWAVDGTLYRTDVFGAVDAVLATVDMAEVAERVGADIDDGTIEAGRLGGIVYHESRGTFWGVDIVNDLYFEFDEQGELPTDGSLRYFLNPMRSRLGGAFGNDITYVANAVGEFFDIPVGDLGDGRPTRVTRVYAIDGDGRTTGDDSGAFYEVDSLGLSPDFITGIVHWSNSCTTDQSTELLMDIRDDGMPQLLEVNVDLPIQGHVTDLTCESGESSVTLRWGEGLPFQTVEIRRRGISEGMTFPDPIDTVQSDEGRFEFTDEGVPSGSYIYTLTATGEQGPIADALVCRVNVGLGAVQESALAGIETPFSVTAAGNDVFVVDLYEGRAVRLDSSLNRVGVIETPFITEGPTRGIAYNSDDGRLYWLQNLGTMARLVTTDLDGQIEGDPVLIDAPAFLPAGVRLGDLTYDAANNWFWTMDLVERVIFPLQPDGVVPVAFRSEPLLRVPDDQETSGGISIASASADSLTIDFAVGPTGGVVRDYIRVRYDIATFDPPVEVFRFDLADTLAAGSVGGIAVISGATIVVTPGTAGVFRLGVDFAPLPRFRRGDVNDDGRLNIADPSALLLHLFDSLSVSCLAATDANGDDRMDVSDAIYLFQYLVGGGPPPGAPFPNCGVSSDTSAVFSCDASGCMSVSS